MLVLASALALARPGADASWEVLDTSPVRIECTEAAGQPWCRSVGLIAAPLDQVAQAMEDMAGQSEVFEAVSLIDELGDDTYRIVLDFPGMFSDRDYVAKFTKHVEGDARIYRWEPVTHPKAPPTDDIVRLERMAGEWRLEPAGDQTKATYLWQAELGGSFPNWALSTARKKAGNEALKDLAKTRKAKLSPPQ
jgi:hypothetical protein